MELLSIPAVLKMLGSTVGLAATGALLPLAPVMTFDNNTTQTIVYSNAHIPNPSQLNSLGASGMPFFTKEQIQAMFKQSFGDPYQVQEYVQFYIPAEANQQIGTSPYHASATGVNPMSSNEFGFFQGSLINPDNAGKLFVLIQTPLVPGYNANGNIVGFPNILDIALDGANQRPGQVVFSTYMLFQVLPSGTPVSNNYILAVGYKNQSGALPYGLLFLGYTY
jgi:hypothetical protein